MNVRSFADLGDILIDTSQNISYNSTLNNSYDEDLFETEAPQREQLRTAERRFSDTSIAETPLDYSGDFEADEVLLPSSSEDMQESDLHLRLQSSIKNQNVVDSSYQVLNVVENQVSGQGPEISMGSSTDVGIAEIEILQSIQRPASTAIGNLFEVSDLKTVSRHLPNAAIINRSMTAGKYLGNHIQFSSVRIASKEDTAVLDKTRKQKEVNKQTSPKRDSREDIIHSLEEMLLLAAQRIEVRSAAVSQVASRAVRVTTTNTGMSRNQAKQIMFAPDDAEIYGIPDYDPDYDCAMEMMEGNMFPHPLPVHSYGTVQEAPSSSSRNRSRSDEDATADLTMNNPPAVMPTDRRAPERNSGFNVLGGNVRRSSVNETLQHTSYQKPPIKAPIINPAVPSRAFAGSVDSLLEEIREERIDSDLLRLGVDRHMLAAKSVEIHSSFLSDLLGKCIASV